MTRRDDERPCPECDGAGCDAYPSLGLCPGCGGPGDLASYKRRQKLWESWERAAEGYDE